MARRCDYCGKGRLKGHRVSHAKNRTIHHFKSNLHHYRVIEPGRDASQPERLVVRNLCTRCLKKAQRPSLKTKKASPEGAPLKTAAKK